MAVCLSHIGLPGAAASTFLESILARVYVMAAPGTPSAQPLQKGHLCFLVRIPLGMNTWVSRSLLRFKGNFNTYPQVKWKNPGLAKRMVMSAEGGSLEGRPQRSGGKRWGWVRVSRNLVWLPHLSSVQSGFLRSIPEFSKNILLPLI